MTTVWDVKEIYRYKTSEMIYYDGERIRWSADHESLKKCRHQGAIQKSLIALTLIYHAHGILEN